MCKNEAPPFDLAAAWNEIWRQVLRTAENDGDFRRQLRVVAQAVLDQTAPIGAAVASPPPIPEPTPVVAEVPVAEVPVAPVAEPVRLPPPPDKLEPTPVLPVREVIAERTGPLPELRLGMGAPRPEASVPRDSVIRTPVTDADLPLIESRCRLKAEGCRWAAERQRQIGQGTDYRLEIEPRDRDLIQRARDIPNCFLWMNHRSGPAPGNLALYDQLAACFEVLATAVAMMRNVQNEPQRPEGILERACELLAEAQSSVRVAVEEIGGPTDSDQQQVFLWLRELTTREQIFLKKFMRRDDPASPADWSGLVKRIEELAGGIEQQAQKTRQRRKLFNKVRYVAKTLGESLSAGTNDVAGNWQTLAATVDSLVESGVPPSSLELREELLPVFEFVPDRDDFPPRFQLVLRELDRFVASRPAKEEPVAKQVSPDVAKVAQMLAGKSVVLIGGERRADAADALKSAFGLSELIWVAPREQSQTLDEFEPYVARSGVAVVLLAIRWVRHAFAKVRDYCELHDRALVRLPGGYNPNQVAAQILQQAGERLGKGS